MEENTVFTEPDLWPSVNDLDTFVLVVVVGQWLNPPKSPPILSDVWFSVFWSWIWDFVWGYIITLGWFWAVTPCSLRLFTVIRKHELKRNEVIAQSSRRCHILPSLIYRPWRPWALYWCSQRHSGWPCALSSQVKRCGWLEDLFQCLPARHGGRLQEEQPGETVLTHVCVQVSNHIAARRRIYSGLVCLKEKQKMLHSN